MKYLCRADTDWLLEDDPGDTLQQGGCGQRAFIGPIIQGTRKKSLRVKVRKGGLLSLEGQKRSQERQTKSNSFSLLEKKERKKVCLNFLSLLSGHTTFVFPLPWS